MNFLIKTIIIFFLLSSPIRASEVNDWLRSEIDYIIKIYKDDNFTNVQRFEVIEESINNNFAGAGIAKFVAGKAWVTADKDIKKTYIKLFKHHLALNIASLMKNYSNQTYVLINSKNDEKNNVILVDMELYDQSSKILITWRIKESKDRFYIIDLLVSDISLVVTKRSEFNSMLKKVDYDLKTFNKVLINQNTISFDRLTKE